MKLICPHCGLKGTADDSLYNRKIRCPECRQIFRLSEEISVSSPVSMTESQGEAVADVAGHVQDPGGVSQLQQSAGGEPEDQGQPETAAAEGLAEEAAIKTSDAGTTEVGKCAVCGFVLSYAYLNEVDSKLYCRVCAPA